GRDDDVFAIAFGQVMPSDDYKKAGSNLNAKDESHLEAYYSFKINDHFTVSPDIQVIWDPYGGDATNGDKTIFVGGVRTQIDF
ncbi:carbohydrate porin, partial [bacterium]|nr:carbohydrate porin [bacterium]